jgi:hypothetical protein
MKRRIQLAGGEPTFWCPVCDRPHVAPARMWKWNGDCDRPTLTAVAPGEKFSYLTYHDLPASAHWILVRPGKQGTLRYASRQLAAGAAPGPDWKPKEIRVPASRHVHCHTYIKDGLIKVLADSERFGGQTLPLPEWEPAQ